MAADATLGHITETSEIVSLARSNLPATGNVHLTILGQNFGSTDYSGLTYIGDSAGAVSEWLSDTSVYSLCRPGERNRRLVR